MSGAAFPSPSVPWRDLNSFKNLTLAISWWTWSIETKSKRQDTLGNLKKVLTFIIFIKSNLLKFLYAWVKPLFILLLQTHLWRFSLARDKFWFCWEQPLSVPGLPWCWRANAQKRGARSGQSCFSTPSLTPDSSVLHSYDFVISRMFNKWDHMVCISLGLGFFTQHESL